MYIYIYTYIHILKHIQKNIHKYMYIYIWRKYIYIYIYIDIDIDIDMDINICRCRCRCRYMYIHINTLPCSFILGYFFGLCLQIPWGTDFLFSLNSAPQGRHLPVGGHWRTVEIKSRFFGPVPSSGQKWQWDCFCS